MLEHASSITTSDEFAARATSRRHNHNSRVSPSATQVSVESCSPCLTEELARRLSALSIVWALQARGLRLKRDDDVIVARPRRLLTRDDYTAVRHSHTEICRILDEGERIVIQ